MPLVKLSASAALLGGLLLVAHALLGGGSDPVTSTLHFLGLTCLVVAAGAFGTTLVKSDAVGMRVVVGLASGLLALSLIEAFRPAGTRGAPPAPTPADPPLRGGRESSGAVLGCA